MKEEQPHTSKEQAAKSRLKPSMVIWPILFGLIGVGYMVWKELHNGLPTEPISLVDYWWVFAILLVLCMFMKDLSGMYRMRVMSDVPLTFRQLYRIRMLYEFTNAATPSAAGGSSLEILFIHREGVKVSRATSMTILALFLDEMTMIILFPALLLLIPYEEMFTSVGGFQYGYVSAFLIGYIVKVVWVALLFIGLFCKPTVFVKIIGAVFSLKILRRFRYRALRTAVELRHCAQEIRRESLGYWLRVGCSTFGIWGFKFLIANMAIMIFNPLSAAGNLMCFARQYILGIVCMIVPTPGGSGFAEVMFDGFLAEFIPQAISAVVIIALWRLFTYYYYLFAGVIILPQWLGKSKLVKTAVSNSPHE